MELKGKSVSPGIAMGAALVYRPFEPCINEQPLPEGGEVEALRRYDEALARLLGELARAFGAAGKELGVCGELGGDALAIPALIGLGIRRLSMGPAALARAKKIVCGLDLAEAQKLAARVCSLATNDEVRAALESFAAEGKVV